ncbi:hypothetical protein K469DRAFT_769612 [Zopfia rhizophila CBS 207.26]|uniref:Uncharacterized protein n=1 Tax=Zopfia rhizophila CBS 207.26 TaxID=1314779 RepID=A0A6A6D8L1_9PEZI|nr:hypothetical protein K469DRAFT_769612 [Zopfia rhizophila CBS 207.26]
MANLEPAIALVVALLSTVPLSVSKPTGELTNFYAVYLRSFQRYLLLLDSYLNTILRFTFLWRSISLGLFGLT